jgi:hypothetical protein
METILRQLEERLLQPETRRAPAEVAALLADHFVEFGSSGRVWDKASTVAALPQEAPATAPRELHDFVARRLAADVVLVTYRLVGLGGAPPASTLRSSIWKSVGERWQMIFHQGTLQP